MHNLDTTNGQTAFVSAREDAWHQLGKTLQKSFTAQEAMTEGLLGRWDVRKQPMYTADENGALVTVQGRNAVVRTNPVDGKLNVLGDVGENYQIIQNEQHAEFLDALVDEAGAHFETAGAIDGGRRVFITMRLPGHISIGGVDKVDQYVAAINSHDGSLAYTFMVTPIRIVCQNTLNLAFGAASHTTRIRHTSGASRYIAQAREALDFTFNYLDGFQEEANQLINTTLTQTQFEEIIAREFGAPEDAPKATVTRTENKLNQMAELFGDASTQAGIRNTAWAGLNAMTEWFDHISPVRGDTPDESRALKAVLEPGFKNRARELMLAV
jgi:phage/plasmid-like protein (TIGR03299 family)